MEKCNVKDKQEQKMYIPAGITSFDELDAFVDTKQLMRHIEQMFFAYKSMVGNVLWDQGESSVDDKRKALIRLTSEFMDKVNEHPTKEFNTELDKEVINGSVSIFKDSNGVLRWYGIVTNKFIDRDNDILSEDAHKNFIKRVDNGEVDYPELNIWHIPKQVGMADWLAYDERGFLAASGYVHKEFEELVINLIKNSEFPIGMSHGMPVSKIKKNGNIIKEYVSFEVSFLPLENAANLLTHFEKV